MRLRLTRASTTTAQAAACVAVAVAVVSESAQAFPRRIAGEVAGPSQLLLLDNCGHVPHREQPQAVLAGVCGFLQQHGIA